ncbi:MAG TPA: response regulator [bacterium]|nr:response regulator [bacterium]
MGKYRYNLYGGQEHYCPGGYMEHKKNILIVDDDPDILAVTKCSLLAGGFSVTAVSSGRECLNALKEGPAPDLILLDIFLRDIDGRRILNIIHKDSLNRNFKIALFTAAQTNTPSLKAACLSADAVIEKPFDPYDLIKTVSKLTGHCR